MGPLRRSCCGEERGKEEPCKALICVLQLNKKFTRWHVARRSSLSLRYQLAENIRTCRAVVPTICLDILITTIGDCCEDKHASDFVCAPILGDSYNIDPEMCCVPGKVPAFLAIVAVVLSL